RDRRIAAGVALDCVYPLARDHLSFPELVPEFEPHKVLEIHLMQWENPHLVVDITDFMDLKIKALACHASQFADFPAVEKRIRERAAELGKPKGYAYAETFDRVVLPRGGGPGRRSGASSSRSAPSPATSRSYACPSSAIIRRSTSRRSRWRR